MKAENEYGRICKYQILRTSIQGEELGLAEWVAGW